MIWIERESSASKPRVSASARSRLLAVSLATWMLASAGCGNSQDQAAAAKPGATPDELAKTSRDYSRALHEKKSKGRVSVRH